MQKYVYLILFALILALPFALRARLLPSAPRETKASNAETLVVVTPHNQDIRHEFEQAFAQWCARKYHQRVKIDYRMPGGSSDMLRLLKSIYTAAHGDSGQLPPDFTPDLHVVFGGGDNTFVRLKAANVLQPLQIDLREAFPQDNLAGVALYDNKTEPHQTGPTWVGACLSGFGIVYNRDVCDAAGVREPQTWADLTDPRLVNLIALADPTHSGVATVAYGMVLQHNMATAERKFADARGTTRPATQPGYDDAIAAGWKLGMGQLLRIVANSRYLTENSNHVPNDVGNGQAAAGVTIDFYGRVFQEMVGANRCKVVLPRGATAITPDPVAILAGVRGEKLTLATRFIEFILSRDGQQLWILKVGATNGPTQRALRRSPIRQDLFGSGVDHSDWVDDMDPFATAAGFNQRAQWMKDLADMNQVWTAAWIDNYDDLKDAYRRILEVPDAAKREMLLAKLADLPIELSEVKAFSKERADREKKGNADQWKAERRLEWGRRFRSHYASVARQAHG